MSFNESDIAAYENESPIPVLKQAYMDYHRNKRKAAMRQVITSNNAQELQDINDLEREAHTSGRRSMAVGGDRGRNAEIMIENGDEDDSPVAHFQRSDRESFHSEMSSRVNEIELVVKDVELTDYSNPNKKLIYAHEEFLPVKITEVVNETEGSRNDQVYHAYTESEAEVEM